MEGYNPNETFMAVVCPICKSSAQELPIGDATGFHCPTHGDFKVANTVFAEAKAKDYTRESNGRLHWTRQSNERNPTGGL